LVPARASGERGSRGLPLLGSFGSQQAALVWLVDAVIRALALDGAATRRCGASEVNFCERGSVKATRRAVDLDPPPLARRAGCRDQLGALVRPLDALLHPPPPLPSRARHAQLPRPPTSSPRVDHGHKGPRAPHQGARRRYCASVVRPPALALPPAADPVALPLPLPVLVPPRRSSVARHSLVRGRLRKAPPAPPAGHQLLRHAQPVRRGLRVRPSLALPRPSCGGAVSSCR